MVCMIGGDVGGSVGGSVGWWYCGGCRCAWCRRLTKGILHFQFDEFGDGGIGAFHFWRMMKDDEG